jgi:hypothetical protein
VAALVLWHAVVNAGDGLYIDFRERVSTSALFDRLLGELLMEFPASQTRDPNSPTGLRAKPRVIPLRFRLPVAISNRA